MTSLMWVNGNRDLRLSIELADGRNIALDFCWVDKLRIDLSFGERENFPPLAWSVQFAPARERRHSIVINFAQLGSISVEFESIMTDGI